MTCNYKEHASNLLSGILFLYQNHYHFFYSEDNREQLNRLVGLLYCRVVSRHLCRPGMLLSFRNQQLRPGKNLLKPQRER